MNILKRFANVAAMPDFPEEQLHYNESLDRFEGESCEYLRGSKGIFRFAPELTGTAGAFGNYDSSLTVNRYTIGAFADELYGFKAAGDIYRHVCELIPEDVDLNESDVIVDAGCGLGRTCYDLAERFPQSLVAGFDLSESMLEVAQRLVSGEYIEHHDESRGFQRHRRFRREPLTNVFIGQASVASMPLSDNVVNILVNVNLIDRLGTLVEKFYLEARRVLKPGGLFLTLDPLSYSNSWEWFRDFDGLEIEELRSANISHAQELIAKYFPDVVSSAGPDFRALEDASGNYRCWRTHCFVARKPD